MSATTLLAPAFPLLSLRKSSSCMRRRVTATTVYRARRTCPTRTCTGIASPTSVSGQVRLRNSRLWRHRPSPLSTPFLHPHNCLRRRRSTNLPYIATFLIRRTLSRPCTWTPWWKTQWTTSMGPQSSTRTTPRTGQSNMIAQTIRRSLPVPCLHGTQKVAQRACKSDGVVASANRLPTIRSPKAQKRPS